MLFWLVPLLIILFVGMLALFNKDVETLARSAFALPAAGIVVLVSLFFQSHQTIWNKPVSAYHESTHHAYVATTDGLGYKMNEHGSDHMVLSTHEHLVKRCWIQNNLFVPWHHGTCSKTLYTKSIKDISDWADD